MAIIQGMCRNCGSLLMLDDRDDKCECVFCNCVFPTSEAIEIMNNPEGRTFANEKFEPSNSGTKHNATRVYSTENLEKRIAREEVKKATSGDVKKNEYEVQASDVKAPKGLVAGMLGGSALVVALILALYIPKYNARVELKNNIESSISQVFDSDSGVDITSDESGKYYNGFSVFGQTCQFINVVSIENLTYDQAEDLYVSYCDLRAQSIDRAGINSNDGVVMKIYCNDGYYTVSSSEGDVESVFTADSVETEG
ncbi:MAG: hypothetical protein MJ094_06185 [Saccharofermentans sp.]|nr:hypothetical protein [Saccharofermentans sp.]